MDFFNVKIEDEAIHAVIKVLHSGVINEGQCVREFEDVLIKFTGRRVLAVSSCTAALHLAYSCVKPCKCLIPTQTFVATATAAVQAGHTPVFVDIDPHTGNISLEDLEKKASNAGLVAPVHFGGMPCDMDAINNIAKKYNLVVVEDAAHALGSTYKGKPVGSLSDFTCFSFQAIKMITSGDGGAITFPESHYEYLRSAKWFGIDKQTVRQEYNERLPSMKMVGFKYNMNNILAAIGLGNLGVLRSKLAKRREIASIFRKELQNVSGFQLLNITEGSESAYWLFPVLVDDRAKFFQKMMMENQIPVKVVNYGIDREPVFEQTEDELNSRPGQRYFDEHQICIPLHEGLSDDDIWCIIKTIKAGW